ncbi:MAG: hypothetical protein K2M80_01195 [Muribaculaceae bacterium]|nr:hypothetical protein [Muribaculaceae bacterium]
MKLLPFSIFLLLIAVACQHSVHINSSTERPITGVPEADSLTMEFDRLRGTLGSHDQIEKIAQRYCSIASLLPDNQILQMRNAYLQNLNLMTTDPGRGYQQLSESMNSMDSAASPFDWYILRSLLLSTEKNVFRKYMQASENIDFFSNKKADFEMAQNLVVKGNASIELADFESARECFDRAEEIFRKQNKLEALYHVKLNKILLYSPRECIDSINSLLADSLIRRSPVFYSNLLQNAYYFTDSVEYLDGAIDIINSTKIDHSDLASLLSMKACTLVYEDKEKEALALIDSIRRAEANYNPVTRNRTVIHNNLAMIYEANHKPDSCIIELVAALDWTDSLQRESNYQEVYAHEAKLRIKEAATTASLKRRNLLLGWGFSIMVLIALTVIIYMRQRRKAELRRSQMQVLDEKIRNERNINFAQSSVLEESERLVTDLNETLESLNSRHLLTPDARRELSRIISAYKSNGDNRAGFLKINREVDSDFARRLKADFPDLAERQLRLAALIAAGVDSRQLSAILNISSKSVYTSRYRLRTRLGLAKEDSLEDFLRQYGAHE